MLGRSLDNGKAGKLLLGEHYYDGSVIAYYYSVLQRMMYALNETARRPLPYNLQNPLNEELHHKILDEVLNRITIRREVDGFKSQFEDLFELRKKADYFPDSISQDECLEGRSLYEGLISKLDRFFPINEG